MSQKFDEAVGALEQVFEKDPADGSGWIVTGGGGPPRLTASPFDIQQADLQTIGEELSRAQDGSGWSPPERIAGLHALAVFLLSLEAVGDGLQYKRNKLEPLVSALVPLKGR